MARRGALGSCRKVVLQTVLWQNLSLPQRGAGAGRCACTFSRAAQQPGRGQEQVQPLLPPGAGPGAATRRGAQGRRESSKTLPALLLCY